MERLEIIKLDSGEIFEEEKAALHFLEDQFGQTLDGIFKRCPNYSYRFGIQFVENVLKNPTEFLNACEFLKEYIEIKNLD